VILGRGRHASQSLDNRDNFLAQRAVKPNALAPVRRCELNLQNRFASQAWMPSRAAKPAKSVLAALDSRPLERTSDFFHGASDNLAGSLGVGSNIDGRNFAHLQ
jgi:hypothetical protein